MLGIGNTSHQLRSKCFQFIYIHPLWQELEPVPPPVLQVESGQQLQHRGGGRSVREVGPEQGGGRRQRGRGHRRGPRGQGGLQRPQCGVQAHQPAVQVQCSTVQHSAAQYSKVQYRTIIQRTVQVVLCTDLLLCHVMIPLKALTVFFDKNGDTNKEE